MKNEEPRAKRYDDLEINKVIDSLTSSQYQDFAIQWFLTTAPKDIIEKVMEMTKTRIKVLKDAKPLLWGFVKMYYGI